jgi:hypothetical protein
MAALNEIIQLTPEIEEKIDSMLLPIGFDKSMTIDTIYYRKGICEFKLWKVRTGCFFFVKLLSESYIDEDVYLIACNNNSYYLHKNFSLDETLDVLTSCEDVNKLDMYMLNRDNLKALEVLACR